MTPSKILIVEDEMIVQLHLKRIVADMGHTVTATATTAQQALAAADRDPPELVLMDIRLPGDRDGVDAAQHLRDTHDCSVVFVTAFADPQTVARTEAVGASGYVVKPFTNAEVRAAIATAFAGSERLRQSRERERSLASILGSMAEAILVIDDRGLISFANPEAARLTGWEVREACDRDIADVVHFSSDDDARAFREALSRSLAARQSDSFSRLEILARDGGERVVRVEIEPIFEQGREASGLLVELRDLARARRRPVTEQPAERRPFGAGTRLLVYSHDTFGLGHLQRCLNVIRTLLANNPGLSVLLVTGSAVAHRFQLPKGADFVKLPAVRKVAPERYESRSLPMSESGIRGLRRNLLLRTVRDYDPHVLLVDHAPVGMKGELLPALEWLHRRGSCTRVLGLRDIIDDPRAVVKLWNEQGVYDVLRELYDHVVVYGSRDIFDPLTRYEFPEDVAAKTRFVHYVCDTSDPEASHATAGKGDEPLIAVSIGGGDGAASLVVGSFFEMLERFRSEIDFRAEILLGPLLSPDLEQRFRERALGLPVVLRDFLPSTTAFFRSAELVVATAGYNTITQLLAHARRAIVIPHIANREEQLVRARCMETLGLLNCLHPDEVTPRRLFELIRASLRGASEPLSWGRAAGVVPLDGATRAAEFFSTLSVASSPSVLDEPND